MKIFLIISFCLIFGLDGFAQTQVTSGGAAVVVEELILARDNGDGKAGDITGKFVTTDTPIHCYVQLSSVKPVTVKMILVAVKAVGLKPETKSVSVSYTTNGKQNQVNFDASPEGVWAAGSYRIDIFLDGKPAKSQTFEIEKSAKEIADEKPAATKNFVPRKVPKKPRKN
jgi:hypothetical protein